MEERLEKPSPGEMENGGCNFIFPLITLIAVGLLAGLFYISYYIPNYKPITIDTPIHKKLSEDISKRYLQKLNTVKDFKYIRSTGLGWITIYKELDGSTQKSYIASWNNGGLSSKTPEAHIVVHSDKIDVHYEPNTDVLFKTESGRIAKVIDFAISEHRKNRLITASWE